MKKTQPYPNETFKDLDEYYEFCVKYQVFGGDALKLKTQMNKLAKRLEPTSKKQIQTKRGE